MPSARDHHFSIDRTSGSAIVNMSFMDDAQMAFLDELQSRGGSVIATSRAFRLPAIEVARCACALDLIDPIRMMDYDCFGRSDLSLPPEIAFEDVVFRIQEERRSAGSLPEFEILQMALAKMKNDESWGFDSFLAFLTSAERVFSACRKGVPISDDIAPIGIDASIRAADKILARNPLILDRLQDAAEADIETYFAGLTDRELALGETGIASLSRSEQKSPAWCAGKLLAMGLIHPSNPGLDPVLDETCRNLCEAETRHGTRQLLQRYAAASRVQLNKLEMETPKDLQDAGRHISVAENAILQLGPDRPAPVRVMTALDHLDRAAADARLYNDELRVLSFAAHSRLHHEMNTIDQDSFTAPNSASPG